MRVGILRRERGLGALTGYEPLERLLETREKLTAAVQVPNRLGRVDLLPLGIAQAE